MFYYVNYRSVFLNISDWWICKTQLSKWIGIWNNWLWNSALKSLWPTQAGESWFWSTDHLRNCYLRKSKRRIKRLFGGCNFKVENELCIWHMRIMRLNKLYLPFLIFFLLKSSLTWTMYKTFKGILCSTHLRWYMGHK